jgi:hypothetical protein
VTDQRDHTPTVGNCQHFEVRPVDYAVQECQKVAVVALVAYGVRVSIMCQHHGQRALGVAMKADPTARLVPLKKGP